MGTITFTSVGGIAVKKDTVYTIADLPSFSPSVTIDALIVSEAPRIWRADYNIDGTQEIRDGKPSYSKSGERGVRVLISRTGANFSSTNPNVPVLYKEGDEIKIHANNTYLFFSDCVVEFGTK